MLFDIVLPSVVSIITIAIVLLYEKFEHKMKSLFEEKEFQIRDAIFLVIGMGVMVTIIAFVPELAIQILFMVAYSFILFLFTYIASEKWYLALLPPAAFLLLYAFSWNLLFLDIFAVVFSLVISIYLGGLFSWVTVLVFAVLITIMDFIQVFGTGFMGQAADKFLNLGLPVLIVVPTFPGKGFPLALIGLGLGDIFLTGLLAIQLTLKYGKRAGIISAITTGVAFFFFEIALLNFEFAEYFPATLIVILGWLAGYIIVRRIT
jgi:presenilin-like A22 family membrane protease